MKEASVPWHSDEPLYIDHSHSRHTLYTVHGTSPNQEHQHQESVALDESDRA